VVLGDSVVPGSEVVVHDVVPSCWPTPDAGSGPSYRVRWRVLRVVEETAAG
jgi:hypothetical protein